MGEITQRGRKNKVDQNALTMSPPPVESYQDEVPGIRKTEARSGRGSLRNAMICLFHPLSSHSNWQKGGAMGHMTNVTTDSKESKK